jgi:predicted RNase H-like nuclease (RuvC/YqgF family)|tara:strand:- start:1130 stop:1366 length:237 start_codon:yes stop_codon:yes gene_type:complete
MTITKEDVERVVRGPNDLEETISKQKKQIEFMQGKCREAGIAILDLEAQKITFKKEIDRLSEENDNLKTMLGSKNEGK